MRWGYWGLLGALAAFLAGFFVEAKARGFLSLSEWFLHDTSFSAFVWLIVGFAIGAIVGVLSRQKH